MERREWERPKDRAYETFTCIQCGEMFPTEGSDRKKCPTCGNECTRESCTVSFTSSEGF